MLTTKWAGAWMAVALAAAGACCAQTYPNKPVRVIFAFAAGGAGDVIARAYKGTGPALPDLLAGRVQVIFEPMVTMLPHVRAGRMKALGVTSLKRSVAAPEIPSLAEQGMEGYDVVLWYGMLAPAGTPKSVVDKLHAALVEFTASLDIREKLSGIGAEPGSTSQAEFGAMIKRAIARWKKVASEAGIRL